MLIPIASIAILRRQRRELDPTKLKELADDIAANGLLHPVVVRRPTEAELAEIGDRLYVLSVGGRRTAAHLLLGRVSIEANLKEDIRDPIQAKIIELSENVRRENLTWQEETDARAELTMLLLAQAPAVDRDRNQSTAPTVKDVAAQVGVTPVQLSRDLKLHAAMKADPTLRTANSKGSALRSHDFKRDMAQRSAAVAANSAHDELRSKLVCDDGREFIKTIETGSIDLVFSDLPYGIDYFEGRAGATEATKGHYDDSADSAKQFVEDIVADCLRVVKPTGWVVFFMCYERHEWLQNLIRDADGDRHFTPELPPWIWTRRGKGNHGHWPELHASNRYEMLVVVNGGQAKLVKKPVENVLDFPPFEGERLHEMQKPHELCREIIERTTVVGERVLDICFGSGAHLAAAASLGRDFLGCDNNPGNLSSALTLVAGHFDKRAAEAVARAKGATGPRLVEDKLTTALELLK